MMIKEAEKICCPSLRYSNFFMVILDTHPYTFPQKSHSLAFFHRFHALCLNFMLYVKFQLQYLPHNLIYEIKSYIIWCILIFYIFFLLCIFSKKMTVLQLHKECSIFSCFFLQGNWNTTNFNCKISYWGMKLKVTSHDVFCYPTYFFFYELLSYEWPFSRYREKEILLNLTSIKFWTAIAVELLDILRRGLKHWMCLYDSNSCSSMPYFHMHTGFQVFFV